jgi:hypothetical protein
MEVFMALDAFKGHLTTAMENTAAALATVKATVTAGTKGWIKNSDVTWISTAVAYYAAKVATDQKWVTGVNPVLPAGYVFIAASIYSIAKSITPPANIDVSALPNINLIRLTNTAAASFFAARRLGLDVTNYTAALFAAGVFGAVSMIHSSQFAKQ